MKETWSCRRVSEIWTWSILYFSMAVGACDNIWKEEKHVYLEGSGYIIWW